MDALKAISDLVKNGVKLNVGFDTPSVLKMGGTILVVGLVLIFVKNLVYSQK